MSQHLALQTFKAAKKKVLYGSDVKVIERLSFFGLSLRCPRGIYVCIWTEHEGEEFKIVHSVRTDRWLADVIEHACRMKDNSSSAVHICYCTTEHEAAAILAGFYPRVTQAKEAVVA